MLNRRMLPLLTLTLLICLCPIKRSAAQETAQPITQSATKPTVQALGWISGCWESTRGKRYNEEHWMKPSGNSMLGMSRTVSEGRTVQFEFLRLHTDKDGNIFYTAKPSGQPETSFKLISWKDNEAVFEDPTHDFPQRIIYRRTGETMQARIEGKMNGQERGVDFPFTRAKCDAVMSN